MITKDAVKAALAKVALPDGGDLIGRDMIRALQIAGDTVRFVIEAPNPDQAARMEPLRAAAQAAVEALPGVASAQVALTAHGPAAKAPPAAEPPSLKIGRHPTPQQQGPSP